MKRALTTVILALTTAGTMLAADTKPVKYTGVMTGVVCSACKKKVRDSFAKIGATKVEFTKGDKEGEAKVTFEAPKDSLTKDDAKKALADYGDEFSVVSLAKAK